MMRRSVAEIPTRLKLRDDGALSKSLARTEEYIAVKRDMNNARQQVLLTGLSTSLPSVSSSRRWPHQSKALGTRPARRDGS